MNNYILLTNKNWHKDLFYNLSIRYPLYYWKIINNKANFTKEVLARIKPEKVFIPHWSYIISSDIYENYECIVFHMTDLPFGRGGSPLQNLIERGEKKTQISAIRVAKGIDTGDVYLKNELSLEGTAQDIFIRSADIIESMIKEIIENDLKPVPQVGESVTFKRRTPAQSNVADINSLEKLYDYIRMLDCEGYPRAFLETDSLKFEFDKAQLKNKEVIANVRIYKK